MEHLSKKELKDQYKNRVLPAESIAFSAVVMNHTGYAPVWICRDPETDLRFPNQPIPVLNYVC